MPWCVVTWETSRRNKRRNEGAQILRTPKKRHTRLQCRHMCVVHTRATCCVLLCGTARVPRCMYVCTYVRMYVCTYVCMYVCTYVRMYVCMYVCTYVCMYEFPLVSVLCFVQVCVSLSVSSLTFFFVSGTLSVSHQKACLASRSQP